MNYYRVSKYNPQFRNVYGHYIKQEWTSFCEIGESFNDHIFTLEDYLSIESVYIDIIMKVLSGCNSIYGIYDSTSMNNYFLEKIEYIKQKKHQVGDIDYENVSLYLLKHRDSSFLDSKIITDVVKIILRYEGTSGIYMFKIGKQYVYFGYDYYIFIRAKKNTLNPDFIGECNTLGVYIENGFISPHLHR